MIKPSTGCRLRGMVSAYWGRLRLYSILRDLVEDHHDAFILNHIDFPDPRKYAGEAYLPAFSESLENLATWIKDEV